MKVRLKTTGEIIEVERITNSTYGRTDGPGVIYRKDALDFNPDLRSPKPEVTIRGWVARDNNSAIGLHFKRPYRPQGDTRWYSTAFAPKCLPRGSFPTLSWQDDPIEVEIHIKPKKS